jgi:DNA-binding response OmpR family regulator
MYRCSPSDMNRAPSDWPPAPGDGASTGTRARLRKALVVEDTEDARELYAGELELAGFEVARAHSGELALRLVHEFEPDVIVLDLMLPGVNGLTVARAIRANEKMPGRIVIVAVTALTSEAMRRMAFEAGCDAVLNKPVLPSIIIDQGKLLLEVRRSSH